MPRKVKMWADAVFRYRIQGSRSWITLTGETWHEAEFTEGDRVEFSSTSTVSNIKIQGSVSNVFIENSEITSLDESFKGNTAMVSATINSATEISSANSAFEGSGIVTVIFDSSKVVSADKIFKDTKDLRSVTIDATAVNTIEQGFSGSGVEGIDSMSRYHGKNASDVFSDATELKQLSGIDLRMSGEGKLTRDTLDVSDKLINELDIMFTRQKVSLRKVYSVDPANTVDDNMNIELDIAGKEYITRAGKSSIEDSLPTDIDPAMNIELDIAGREYITRSNKKTVEDGLETDIDDNMNLEVDMAGKEYIARSSMPDIDDGLEKDADPAMSLEVNIKHKNLVPANRREDHIVDTGLPTDADDTTYTLEVDQYIANNDIPMHRRENHVVDTGLDESYDPVNYTLEVDQHIVNNNIPMHRRENHIVDTGLDTAYDPNTYTLEFDMHAGSDNVDPLDDGSCIYYIGKDNHSEMISGDMFPEPANGWKSNRVSTAWGDVCSPIRQYAALPISDATVLDSVYKNIYVRFDKKSGGTEDAWSLLFSILNTDGSQRFSVLTYFRSSGNMLVAINLADTDNGSASTVIQKEFAKPSGKMSIAIIETSSGSNSYRLIFSGEDIGGYDITLTDAIASDTGTLCQNTDGRDASILCGVQVFNRPLSIADVQLLDTIK